LSISPQPLELADALTHLGLEVEGIIEQRTDFQGVKVGQLLSFNPCRAATILRFARSLTAKKASPSFAVHPI